MPVPNNNWASALAANFVPPPENSLLSQTGPAYEVVKVFHPDVIHLQFQMEECHKLLTNQVDEGLLRYNVSRPLPLGGPPGQVMIQTKFFFNKDLEYLRFGHKGNRLALSITKMKAASYPDAGLEHMVPDQMWAEEEYMYDISASYGHLNHLPSKDKKILSTAVNLWIRNFVIRKRVEDLQLGIESYQTPLNLTKPRWEDTGLEFMHDYKILDSLRLVVFRDRYGMQMIMRFNEIHKFSDGTLQQIDEALDYRVKEFKVNKVNPGLNTRTWKALLVDAYEKETTDFFREPNDRIFSVSFSTYSILRSRQSQRDLPRDNLLVSVEVLRNQVTTYAVIITWLIADIEDKYHGPSDTQHNPS
ncbi:hypothetical protein Tco_1187262 [Tanacetum coccineum]